MNRRSFLAVTLGLTASSVLTGCSTQTTATLKVRLLNGSVPAQLLNEFRSYLRQLSASELRNLKLEFTPETQLQSLFSLLQNWVRQPAATTSGSPLQWLPGLGDRTPKPTDLVLIGHYWLSKAVAQKLIHPLEPESLKGWKELSQNQQWQQLVTRNDQGRLDPNGKVWGVPHRWGTTVIAYRKDILQQRGIAFPTDWNDLWRPELQGHISVLDQPREVIGLTLKKLGQSYNTSDISKVPQLQAELDALQRQVKLYSSDNYLQPLLLGDTWVAVGWSTDVLPVMQRYREIAAVIPQSGTALWADLWVNPVSTVLPTLASQWIDFCWQPQIAQQISLRSNGTSPVVTEVPGNRYREQIRLTSAQLQRSEFLLPLTTSVQQQYDALWQTIRT